MTAWTKRDRDTTKWWENAFEDRAIDIEASRTATATKNPEDADHGWRSSPQLQKSGLPPRGRLWVCCPSSHEGQVHRSRWARRTELGAKADYSQTLKSNRICCASFLTYFESKIPYSFQFHTFRTGMSILCQSHPCILEAGNLSDFPGSQLERNFSRGYDDCDDDNDGKK